MGDRDAGGGDDARISGEVATGMGNDDVEDASTERVGGRNEVQGVGCTRLWPSNLDGNCEPWRGDSD